MTDKNEVRKTADHKRAVEQIQLLKNKKTKIAETVAAEARSIDRDIAELQKMLSQ